MPTTPMNLYYTALLLIFVIAIGILLFSYSKIAKAIIKSELNLRKHVHIEQENISQNELKECFCSAFCCNTNKIHPALQSMENRNGPPDTKSSVRSEAIKRYGDGGKIISNEQIIKGELLSDAANKQSNILNAQQGTSL